MLICKIAYKILGMNMLRLENKKHYPKKFTHYATEDSAIGRYAQEARHS